MTSFWKTNAYLEPNKFTFTVHVTLLKKKSDIPVPFQRFGGLRFSNRFLRFSFYSGVATNGAQCATENKPLSQFAMSFVNYTYNNSLF